MSRPVEAIALGVAVAGGQFVVTGLAMLLLAGITKAALLVFGGIADVALVFGLLVLPVLCAGGATSVIYDRLSRSRLRPSATFLTTILCTLSGLALGGFIGSTFERGHMRGGGWQSLLGSFVGCLLLVAAANLKKPLGPDEG